MGRLLIVANVPVAAYTIGRLRRAALGMRGVTARACRVRGHARIVPQLHVAVAACAHVLELDRIAHGVRCVARGASGMSLAGQNVLLGMA